MSDSLLSYQACGFTGLPNHKGVLKIEVLPVTFPDYKGLLMLKKEGSSIIFEEHLRSYTLRATYSGMNMRNLFIIVLNGCG